MESRWFSGNSGRLHEGPYNNWITMFSIHNLYGFFLEKLLFCERSVSGTFLRLQLLGLWRPAWGLGRSISLLLELDHEHSAQDSWRQTKQKYAQQYLLSYSYLYKSWQHQRNVSSSWGRGWWDSCLNLVPGEVSSQKRPLRMLCLLHKRAPLLFTASNQVPDTATW